MTTLTNNPTLGMYVSAVVAVVVIAALFVYLWSLDRRVNELRRSLRDQPAPPLANEPLRPQRRVQEEHIDGNISR